MNKLVKSVIAVGLSFPIIASAAMSKDEMLTFSSEHIDDTTKSEISISKVLADNWLFGADWKVTVKGKNYNCQKPGLPGLWIIGKGCTAGIFYPLIDTTDL